jgi:hypothetical protein
MESILSKLVRMGVRSFAKSSYLDNHCPEEIAMVFRSVITGTGTVKAPEPEQKEESAEEETTTAVPRVRKVRLCRPNTK